MRSLLSASLVMIASLSAADDTWKPLPSLPDAEGFAGSFAGVSGSALLVAGGTNFPDKRPWEGGTKIWYDTIYALSQPDGPWHKAGRLPKPNGYGVSITTGDGLVCIGGGDQTSHFREVYRLRYASGKISFDTLPQLPRGCAFMSGVEMNGKLYVAGGIETPTATEALNTLWMLDLKHTDQGWREQPPCPGPARILATMAANEGALYLISGAGLKADAEGKPARVWLNDAWSYQPESGWKQLPDVPRVSVAAPSPAPVIDGRILVLGGDDGANVNFEPKEKHPGFPRDVLVYAPSSGQWVRGNNLPFSLVTTPAVSWRGQIVIPGGEARPGKRSPEVWGGYLAQPK